MHDMEKRLLKRARSLVTHVENLKYKIVELKKVNSKLVSEVDKGLSENYELSEKMRHLENKIRDIETDNIKKCVEEHKCYLEVKGVLDDVIKARDPLLAISTQAERRASGLEGKSTRIEDEKVYLQQISIKIREALIKGQLL